MSMEEDAILNNNEEMQEETEKLVKEEEDLTGDGGVKKKILKEGTGWEKPEAGSEVICHYTGKLLDGTVFDSSRTRGEEFKFKLGQNQVIKGWEEGFKHMKKGEQALLTIKPEYGYGAAGSPPKIPPNSTLQFEVELINWVSEEDISSDKDRSLLKKTLKAGDGWQNPKEDEVVTINYTLRVDDKVVEEKQEFKFRVGAEEVVAGLDQAVQKLKKGERAIITVAPQHAFGKDGRPEQNIPPNSTLKYEVELVDWEKEKDSWKMNTEEKLEASLKAKNEGNELFKQGKLHRAYKKYKKAIDFVQYDHSFSDEEKEKAKQIKLPCHLNSAICHLKMKEWTKTIEDCKKVFELDKENVKGLFRRGQAYLALDKWEEAMADFERAKEKSTDAAINKEIDVEIGKLKRKQSEHSKIEKQLYSKMFAAM